MQVKLYPKTETFFTGYSIFPASNYRTRSFKDTRVSYLDFELHEFSRLRVNSGRSSSIVGDQNDLRLGLEKKKVASGDPKVRDPPVVLSKECECGQGGERFSRFGRLFSKFSNGRGVVELVVRSSPFRLALVWKTYVFEKSSMKTAPQLIPVVFNASTKLWFSYQPENPEVLSVESNESLRNVTLCRFMSHVF